MSKKSTMMYSVTAEMEPARSLRGGGGNGGGTRGLKWPVLAGAVIVAAIVGVLMYLVVHSFVGEDTPAAAGVPSAPTVTATADHVAISWKSVSGAQGYVVSRDGQVIYRSTKSGDDTTRFDDYSATAGEHTYTVSAIGDDDRLSAASAGEKATAPQGYGEIAPLMRRLGTLLPTAPGGAGFDDMRCVVRRAPVVGADQSGAQSTARLVCDSPKSDSPKSDSPKSQTHPPLTWYVDFWDSSKARDLAVPSFAPGATKVTWAHGDAYQVAPQGTSDLMLTFSDPDRSAISILLNSDPNALWAPKDLLDYANSLPVGR